MFDQRQIEGDTLRRTTELTVAGSQTMCFEYDAPSASSNSIIACNVEGTMVVNFFFDDQELKPTFYQILSGVR